MTTIAFGWLALQAMQVSPAGEAMAMDLRAAARGVAQVRICAERDPERLEETHRAFATRLAGLDAAAAELLPDAEPLRKSWAEEDGEPTWADCRDEAFAAARDGAAAAMDAAQAMVDEALGTERRQGLWLGGLKVCGAQARVGLSRHGEGQVHIVLRAQQQAELARITGERVGRAMPVWLDGRVVSAPMVREAIAGGAVAISSDGEALDAVGTAVEAAC